MQRQAQQWRRQGIRVGLVPTMGYLHEGHLSLVRRARRTVGPQGQIVVSVYVNPMQFGPGEDLKNYPRDFSRDRALCLKAGVDVIFAPSDGEMYPARGSGGYSTYVAEEALSKRMEGESRPTHFRGVTTVVAKLFNVVLPEVAVFGAKDFQQSVVLRRMTRDLNFPVRIVVAPTQRERDGLAMSSRNEYLNAGERQQARALWQAIGQARRRVRAKRGGVPAVQLIRELTWLIETRPAARVGYIAFFNSDTLEPVDRAEAGVRMALAVQIGRTRLIDNARL